MAYIGNFNPIKLASVARVALCDGEIHSREVLAFLTHHCLRGRKGSDYLSYSWEGWLKV